MENMNLAEKIDQLKLVNVLEKHRIDSFMHWPFDEQSSCSKSMMAQAGFYWTGSEQTPDLATCFVCNKTLSNWKRTDEPWKEHEKHAPLCAFVMFGRPEGEMSLREFLEIFRIVLKNKIAQQLEKLKAILEEEEAAKALKKLKRKKS